MVGSRFSTPTISPYIKANEGTSLNSLLSSFFLPSSVSSRCECALFFGIVFCTDLIIRIKLISEDDAPSGNFNQLVEIQT